jgi:Ca2+-transporting ATPase
VLLQLGLLYLPFMHDLFRTQPLSAADLAVCVASASVVFWAVELEKWLGRRRGQQRR